MHKEGITELHQFLKAYPHKKQRVEKLLESTGTAFRKYITRALASRAAEDSDRDAAVAHTLSSKFPLILTRGSSNIGYDRTRIKQAKFDLSRSHFSCSLRHTVVSPSDERNFIGCAGR